ncbi:MAG: hypothetical protein ACREV7_07505 [Steroidobacteraceae bacterium]
MLALWATLAAGVMAQVGYAHMAPLSKYLPAKASDEARVARSAAPASISDQAEILTFGPHGYTTFAKGSNGFVCLVERAWDHRFKSSQFWNPQHRAPICYNPKAARTVLPIYLQRTQWVLAGMSLAQMAKRTGAELASRRISVPTSGAMSYMMSKEQNICSSAGGCSSWYPHLMYFLPRDRAPDWGANLKGTFVFSGPGLIESAVTMYFVLVPRWSDKTPSPADT